MMMYTIDIVSKKTGLAKNTIRAWELRYNLVKPDRTGTNRRLYTQDDIARLKLLKHATRSGYRISGIANLSIDELRELTGVVYDGNNQDNPVIVKDEKPASHVIDECMAAVREMDDKKLTGILNRISVEFSKPKIINSIILPLFRIIGDYWHEGGIRIYHEHFASSVFKTYLVKMRDNNLLAGRAPKIVISTPAGELHEIGALAASVLIAAAGWDVIYLGSDTPAQEIASAALKSGAGAVALSIIYTENPHFYVDEINKLCSFVPEIPVIIGGNIKETLRQGINAKNAVIVCSIEEVLNRLPL